MVPPTGKVLPLGGILTTLTAPQLSVAVTEKVTLLLLHSPGSAATTIFDGQVITGGCVSRTITCCWQVAMLPLLSITVQVTRLVPTGNCAGALFVTVTVPQLSLVVGLPNTTFVATHSPASVLVVTSGGHVMVGTCVSVTVTVKMQTLVLPLLSIAA